jgi:starch synthase
MTAKLKVLFLASEAAPFVKVGGLGDVAGALPPALHQLPDGPDIRIVIPAHKQIDRASYSKKKLFSLEIPWQETTLKADIYTSESRGVPVYLIDGEPFLQAVHIYTANTELDGHKYAFFSIAALALAKQLVWTPDILHANDWHTALAVYVVKTSEDPFFDRTSTVLTVHNLPYLGNGAGPALPPFGIEPPTGRPLPWWAREMPLPMGLLTADKITTVSNGYAREMLTKPFGSGLHRFLRSRKKDLIGIVNGIDTQAWDPETDPDIPANFSTNNLTDRSKNKTALLKEIGLDPDPDRPLLAFIGRMDHQKGIEIALSALRLVKDQDWQAVILGTGDPEIEAWAQQLAADLPNRVHTAIRFDLPFSRLVYSGADAILIPSRYEPCGLIQMIAMRYGCVPIARATGGLQDTITDPRKGKLATGFLFKRSLPQQMAKAIQRALKYYNSPADWQRLQHNGMTREFSWEKSALEYHDLYRSLTSYIQE